MADSAPIDFPVLKIINDARSTYGLRHQDFDRYQSHCSTKVHHLRKALGLTQVAGRQKKYTKRDVTSEIVTDSKHLQLVLFDAERAWAQSQHIQSTLSQSTSPATTKHHLLKRLSRSILRAAHLVSLVESSLASRISATQRAQVIAYHLVLQGQLAFIKQNHSQGLETLSVAWALLNDLANNATTATDEALTNEKIDDVEPMLRFCAYSLQLDTSKGVAVIAQKTATEQLKARFVPGYMGLIEEVKKEAGQSEREKIDLSWRGNKIECRSPDLVEAMLKVQSAIKILQDDSLKGSKRKQRKVQAGQATSSELKRAKSHKKDAIGTRRMGAFDKALLVMSDAEGIARQAIEDNKVALSKSQSPRFEASSSPLQLAHSYIVYQLLSVRTQRDLLLIKESSLKLATHEAKMHRKERDFIERTGGRNVHKADQKIRKRRTKVYPSLVKIYDGIIYSLEQVRDLEDVERDGQLATKVEAQIAFVRASRCLYLSRTYALINEFASALALNARSKLYARQARSTLATLDGEDMEYVDEIDFIADSLPLHESDFTALDSSLNHDYDRFAKDWFNATGGRIHDPEDLPVAAMSLEASSGGASKMSKKRKIPKKKKTPFYDVAFNYVTAYDMDEIARRAGLLGPVEEEVTSPAADTMDEDEDEDEELDEEEEEKEKEKPVEVKKSGWSFGNLFGRR
ncbi:BQ2448_3025 [Microbotryum intermedium]|uniref:Signal recognition particle subunit SRP68 n=1 Tax=Microbotryum intermedium TaxID=269621 RepID=A0A238FDZ9_9BASI|nr:BQ2448_3025 [Microbotryum intermedium]